MAKSLGTLGDLFPDKQIQCCVRGCRNLLRLPGDKSPLPAPDAPDAQRPNGMCDACYARFQTLRDQQVPCAGDGCTQTWTWTPAQQLEALANGNPQPPKQLCAPCQARRRDLQDKPLPCKIKGCPNSFTWTREEQWHDGVDSPPSRLCQSCFQRLRDLDDKEVPCRIPGCTATWVWNRFQQLEHAAAGKALDAPPRRMCRDCMSKLRDLQDTPVPCKVKGCARTWMFTGFAQLEYLLSRGPGDPPPARMCPECFKFFSESQDRQIQCRHRGCPTTWLYTRQTQLHDWIGGRTQPPARLCQPCTEKIKHTPDRAMPCAVPSCKNTWNYPAADQVRDQCAGKGDRTPRRCARCEEFLAQTKAATTICPRCQKESTWSAYEQLLCQLGAFATPGQCASCTEQELALQRPAELPIQRQNRHVVRMPGSGRWASDPLLSQARPPHIDADVIAGVEAADVRIVAFGDDLTYSAAQRQAAWPYLLEKRMNEELTGRARVAVVNAGIPHTTSQHALLRLSRDVMPFAPHLVIFSLAFGDALLNLDRYERQWPPLIPAEAAAAAMEQLCQRLKSLNCALLFWTTNPILPQDLADAAPEEDLAAWVTAQEASHHQRHAHALHLCATHHIPILDLRSRFEVNGKKSARKWMSDWCNHNAAGAQNIATWMAEYLLHADLLPLPQKPAEAPAPPDTAAG